MSCALPLALLGVELPFGAEALSGIEPLVGAVPLSSTEPLPGAEPLLGVEGGTEVSFGVVAVDLSGANGAGGEGGTACEGVEAGEGHKEGKAGNDGRAGKSDIMPLLVGAGAEAVCQGICAQAGRARLAISTSPVLSTKLALSASRWRRSSGAVMAITYDKYREDKDKTIVTEYEARSGLQAC